jgi:hypothetical protein
VRDLEDSSLSSTFNLTVTVLPEVSLELRLLESPPFVLAGKTYTASFVLSNLGNAEARTSLDIVSASGYPFEIQGFGGGTEALLEAGESKAFGVTVRTDAALSRSTRHSLQVTARFRPAESASPSTPTPQPVAASSSVEVVPLSLDDRIINHYVAMNSETTAEGRYEQGFGGSLQEQIRGKGSLDELGEHRIAMDVHKALDNTQDLLLNPQDSYSITYDSKYGEILLGDLPYSVSPLIAMDSFGRGAGATLNLYPFRAGALYFTDFRSTPGSQGLGASLDFTIPRFGDWEDPVYRAGLNVFSPLNDRVAFGLLQKYSPMGGVGFELDTAIQRYTTGMIVPAVFGRTTGDLGSVFWTGRYLRSWPGFKGTSDDIQSILAATGIRFLNGNLVVNGGFYLEDKNLLLDDSLPNASHLMEIALGSGGKIPGWDTKLRLDWENWRRVDLLPTPDFSGWDNIFRFSLTQPLKPFTFGLSSTIDLAADDMSGGSSLDQQHLMTVALEPDSASRYNLSLRYGDRRDSEGHVQFSAGWAFSAEWTLGRTRVEGEADNLYDFTLSGPAGLFGGLRARVSSVLPWGHTVSAEGSAWVSSTRGEITPSFNLSLGYAVPFDVPIGRKADTSVVTGHVFDQSTGLGMPGVLLRLNDLAAMSGAKGEFTFYVPQSGAMYVQVDMGTIGAGMVPVKPMPMEVSASKGSRSSLEIGITRGCAVSGNVGVYGFPVQSNAFVSTDQTAAAVGSNEVDRVRLSGLGGIIVELSGESEVRRRLTSPNGDFSFPEVRPGKYTLRVAGGMIPSYHKLDPSSFDFDLAPGEERTVEFRAAQEQRTIKIINTDSSVILETGPEAEAEPTPP